MLSEGPGFESRLGHHFSMVLSSLSGSRHYPCSAENVKEMAAHSEMCWANEELEFPVGNNVKFSSVWLICPFGGRPITSGKLVGQTEEFCQSAFP